MITAGGKTKMVRKKEAAVAALLTASTIAIAAQSVGISEVTLWRWLQQEDFQEAYRQAKRQAVAQAVSRLQQATTRAVDTLEEIMSNTNAKDSARVAAARTVLEMALKAIELEDIVARVEELERLSEQDKEGASDWTN